MRDCSSNWLIKCSFILVTLVIPCFAYDMKTIWLDELNLEEMTCGWRAPKSRATIAGRPLDIQGEIFQRGVGTHAPSEYRLKLDQKVQSFTSWVGVDDFVGDDAPSSVEFIIKADGRILWQSGIMKADMSAKQAKVNLTGTHVLQLIVTDGGNGIACDNSIWADAHFVYTGSPPEPMAIYQPYKVAPRLVELAPTPPMGWNSWDCYGPTVREDEVKANADYMEQHLARFGWQYIVVDIQWYEPKAKSHGYRKYAKLDMDEYGRLIPAVNRFPSSADGKGFKPLADYVHSKGLKFGIHIMRGIPRQAVDQNTLVMGTEYHAADIANKNSVCQWCTDMYGLRPNHPGSQKYYESIIQMYADWGVDYIKVDNISSPYYKGEIELVSNAIQKCGRPIVLSLSPGGATHTTNFTHIAQHANLVRISTDFWDKWPLLLQTFSLCRKWSPYVSPGCWPDADMLPLGHIGIRAEKGDDRMTELTRDEQFTHMTLWSIFQSPLMFGGDLPSNDDFTLSLLTNPEVLSVNQHSQRPREIYNKDDIIMWRSEIPDSDDFNLAVFNISDQPEPREVTISLNNIGIQFDCHIRDLWKRAELGVFDTTFTQKINSHGAKLYRISPIDHGVLLFDYFMDNGQDGLHLAYSEDGLIWEKLNKGKSFLKPTAGKDKLMRDPCVLRGPDGIFHMVWTVSWHEKGIGYASSPDLIHWSEQKYIPVMEHEPDAINCWAPELFYDQEHRQYLIFWATTIPDRFPETRNPKLPNSNHRIYVTKTKDFETFTKAELFYNQGFNVIDSTIINVNNDQYAMFLKMVNSGDGRYAMFLKDETNAPLTIQKNIRIAWSDSPSGPWGPPSQAITGKYLAEGPTVIHQGRYWIVYFDKYEEHCYGALRSTDMKHWEDISDQLYMPKGIRHGTVFRVPGKVLKNLLKLSQ